MFKYNAKVIRVVDGDTVDALVDLGFSTFKKVRIRMMGINAPESRTRDMEEKAKGLAAKIRLEELLEGKIKKYDLITAFHVFEHLADPISILKNLSKLLIKVQLVGTLFPDNLNAFQINGHQIAELLCPQFFVFFCHSILASAAISFDLLFPSKS